MSKVKNSRKRNWAPEELEVFAFLLVDEENCFSDFWRRWKRIEVISLLLNVLPYDVLMFNIHSNISLDTRKCFLNSQSPQLLYPSIHHDLFRTLLLVLSFLSFTTPMSSSISSSFIFLLLHHISSISSISSSRFFYIFLKRFENHPSSYFEDNLNNLWK